MGVMKRDAAEILKDALAVPIEARAALAGSLLESLETDIDEDAEAAWATEVNRRIAELDSGVVRTIPGQRSVADSPRADERCKRRQYAFSILRGGHLALSCRRRMGLAPGRGARARAAHSGRRKCPRRSGAHSGFGTRRKSPRADARLHAYGNANTAICRLGVDAAVGRFRDECVGNGPANSSGFRICDRRCYRAHRDRRGKHPSDIHSLGLVALRNCA